MKLRSACLLLAFVFLPAEPAVFSASAPVPRSAEELRRILDAPAPDPKTTPKAGLAKIYLERARAAGMTGNVERQLRELNEGIAAVGPKDPLSYPLYDLAARTLLEVGDWKAGRTMRENALEVTNNRASKFFQANFLTGNAVRLLDKEGSKKHLALAEELFAGVRATNQSWPEFRNLWEAALSDARGGVYAMIGRPELLLSVLVTTAFKPVKSSQNAPAFAKHAEAPWLLKQAASHPLGM